MNRLPRKLLVSAAGVCLLGTLLCVLLPRRSPYRRLDFYSSQVLRLATSPNRYTLQDRLNRMLHRGDPYQYYAEQAQAEQQRLLASGRLVEAEVGLPEHWSQQDLVAALRKTSGVYWAVARLDTTNHLARLICKPQEVEVVRQILRNE